MQSPRIVLLVAGLGLAVAVIAVPSLRRTLAARNVAGAAQTNGVLMTARLPLRVGLSRDDKMTASLEGIKLEQALAMYADLTGRTLLPPHAGWGQAVGSAARDGLSRLGLVKPQAVPSSGIIIHGDGLFCASEVKAGLEGWFQTNHIAIIADGTNAFHAERMKSEVRNPKPERSPKSEARSSLP